MPKVSSSTISDLRNAQDRLKRFLGKLESVPVAILTEEATRMQAEMRLKTPIGDKPDSPRLQQGVKCEVTKSGDVVTLKASASAKSRSENYDYAWIQHETTFYNHPRGGGPFFVSGPFKSGVLRIKERFKKEVKY